MRLEIHDEAAKEIRSHHQWYLSRNPPVAHRLARFFEVAAVEIARSPLRFPFMEMENNPGNIRRARLAGFPLYIVYCILDETVSIVAVPHTSQRPEYWQSRLK